MLNSEINRCKEALREISLRDRDDAAARAFNQGSDARLAGDRMADNPYDSHSSLGHNWTYGWKDVDRNWGKEAMGPVRTLKPVRWN